MSLFKNNVDAPAYEKDFIRQSLLLNCRLDGRNIEESRMPEITVARGEFQSSSDVRIGESRAVCVVRGEVCSPFPDRPHEGIFNISVDTSQASSYIPMKLTVPDLERFLERVVKDSGCIDAESLCIHAGRYVWAFYCDIRILDFSGGNVVDLCVLSLMAALRNYRKLEVSVNIVLSEVKGMLTTCRVQSSDEKDPLPLALHHTSLSVSFALFYLSDAELRAENKRNLDIESISNSNIVPVTTSISSSRAEYGLERTYYVIVADPMMEEGRVMDGYLSVVLNSHGEITSINKPGGVAVPMEVIMRCVKLAMPIAAMHHSLLSQNLQEFEEKEAPRLRNIRNQQLRNKYQHEMKYTTQNGQEMNVDGMEFSERSTVLDGEDPVLQYQCLHQPANSHSSAKIN